MKFPTFFVHAQNTQGPRLRLSTLLGTAPNVVDIIAIPIFFRYDVQLATQERRTVISTEYRPFSLDFNSRIFVGTRRLDSLRQALGVDLKARLRRDCTVGTSLPGASNQWERYGGYNGRGDCSSHPDPPPG